MGVSGGSMSTMVLTLYGKPIHAAVGTAAGLGVPLTIAGTIGYMLAGLPHQALTPPFSLGFVSLIGVALMAPVSSFTAIYGVRVAHALPRRQLEIAFGIFLLRGVDALSREPDSDAQFARSTSRSPRTSELCSRLRKLMPSRLVRNCPGCAISAGTARSSMPPTVMRSSVTGAARVRPFAVSTVTE